MIVAGSDHKAGSCLSRIADAPRLIILFTVFKRRSLFQWRSLKTQSSWPGLFLAVLCITPFFAEPVPAQERTTEQSFIQQEVNKTKSESPDSQSGYGFLFFPPGHLYAPYLADPHQIGFGLQVLHYYRKTGIPESGSTRFDLKSGGQFCLMRIHPRGSEDLGWEFGLEAGFHAQFDIEHQLDNIGWDGRYGFTVTTAQTRNLSMKFG